MCVICHNERIKNNRWVSKGKMKGVSPVTSVIAVTGTQELGAGFQVLGLRGKGLERQAHTDLYANVAR